MSFVTEFESLPLGDLLERSRGSSETAAHDSLAKSRLTLTDFAHLISPAAAGLLETMGHRSRALTQQRFGKVMRLFAPLYLSNECVNNCRYCGFSRDNPILRVTLSVDEVLAEAQALKQQGFRNLLLVAGEHPKFISPTYLQDCVQALHAEFPSISLEVGPMDTAAYQPLVAAGAEGLVVYQETYDPTVYSQVHTSGPKRKFEWRMETPERAYAAGFRRLGIGALFGLADWRYEALGVAAHALCLQRHCWKAALTISLPRLRPHAGVLKELTYMSDLDVVQLVCAFRLMFPDVGLVLSTRERASLRNGLIPLGITLMSAGSHTEPGGYTGAGKERIHLTQRGRTIELTPTASAGTAPRLPAPVQATVQFDIADERSPQEVAVTLQRLGYEPVWKDWDAALTA